MNVFINPGHAPDGNPDPGAVNPNSGTRECDIALQTGELVKSYLEAAGCAVQLLQCDDLGTICSASNDFGADVFVSIHCNACAGHDARGTETWYKTISGQRLAGCIQSQIIRSVTTTDRGQKQTDGLWVLNDTNAPAALVELGFIDNDDDLAMIQNNMDRLARAIARGVTDFMQ